MLERVYCWSTSNVQKGRSRAEHTLEMITTETAETIFQWGIVLIFSVEQFQGQVNQWRLDLEVTQR